MRLYGILFSLLLHAGVLLAGMFFGGFHAAPIKLSMPVYQVQLVSLQQPAPPKKAAKVQVKAKKDSDAKPIKAQEPEKKAKPAPKSASVPKPKPAPKPKPKPKAKPISPKKSPAKIRKPKKTKKPKPKPAPKPEVNKKRVIAGAFKDVAKQVAKEEKSERAALNKELAALKKDVKAREEAQAALGTPDGQEGAAASTLYQVYGQIVVNEVRANWRYPVAGSASDLSAVVELKIGSDGSIEKTRIVESSGRPGFDASVLKAVAETGKLTSPPTRNLRLIQITFKLQELAQ